MLQRIKKKISKSENQPLWANLAKV